MTQVQAHCLPFHWLPGRVRGHVPKLAHNATLARHLSNVLGTVAGIRQVTASPVTGNVLVIYEPEALSLPEICRYMEEAVSLPAQAPPVAPGNREPAPVPLLPNERQATSQMVLTGAALCTVAVKRLIYGPSLLAQSWRTYDLAGIVTIVASYPYLRRGLQDLFRTGRLTGDAIIGAAGIASLLLRENVLGLAVLFFNSLSRLLVARAAQECDDAMESLLPPEETEVRILREGTPTLVGKESLRPGDTAVVRGGEMVPADGKVSKGTATVDRSILTGEAALRVTRRGDQLLAGSRVVTGELKFKVTAVGVDTEMGRILHAAKDGAPPRHGLLLAEQHTQRAAGWGRWAMGVALVTGLATGDWRRALAALIAAAPAASMLAVPLPLVAGAVAAGRRGILVKNTDALAAAGSVDTVLFDKTGTLTLGSPVVMEVLPVSAEWSAEQVLALAAAAEEHALHPFGRAIRQAARTHHVKIPPGHRPHEEPGQGATAVVAHHQVWVGSEGMMIQRGALNARSKLLGKRLQLHGYSVVYVACDGKVIAVVGLADQLRPKVREALEGLRSIGMNRLGLMTGDDREAAQALTAGLGLDPVLAEIGPAEKASAISALKQEGRTVALVGDGINDVPGLAAADLGLVLGHAASRPAIQASGAVIMGSDLRGVPELLHLGRQAAELSRQNHLLAAGMNATGLGLAASGALGPLAASIWHNLTSLMVISNSMRLLPRHQPSSAVSNGAALRVSSGPP